jgi:catechol 2,3-dioxygenase-like lactoylglutathione lyase family enzyme
VNDLEPHRKRAKHLVRQHHAGVHVVAHRIRQALPRFAGMTDREVLDADFALHDAQHLLAVELGFDSWTDLKENPPMTAPASTNELRFERATACLFVTDFDRAIAFYRDTLGFGVTYTYGEPPFWGELERDGALLNLRFVAVSPWVDGVRDAGQLLAAYVLTTDAKSLFVEYQDRGVDFHTRLERKPWEMNEFVVRDPDGNLILFGSPD